VNNLNKAIEGTPLADRSIEDILKGMDMKNMAVRNNGGGHYNHSLFWSVMAPNAGGTPSGDLAGAIDRDLGGLDAFKESFSKAAATRFGSGWAWLCVHKGGKLEVCSTPNQDNPLMPDTGCGGTPILGVDVWEHAYYLHYQNRRPDYLAAWWNVVDWNAVSKRYDAAK
jgi:Fe-Mn family superoxide dismutase